MMATDLAGAVALIVLIALLAEALCKGGRGGMRY